MVKVCAVDGCKSNQKKDPDLIFYSFPKQPSQKQLWIDFCRRTAINGKPWTSTSSSRICNSHFVGGKKVNEIGHPSYYPSIYGSSQSDQPPSDAADEVAKDDATIVSENSMSVVSCGLCQQSILLQDCKNQTSHKRKQLPEEKAFVRITRMLGINTESVLLGLPEGRAQPDCAICNCCNEVIDRGLTLMEEIKTLQTQLQNLRHSVIKRLRRDDPGNTSPFEQAKKALGKCFQQCSVQLFDAGVTNEYQAPRKKARLQKGEGVIVSTSMIGTSAKRVEDVPVVVIKRDRDEEEEAFRGASPEANYGGTPEPYWETFDNSESNDAEEGVQEPAQGSDQVEPQISVEAGGTDSCIKGRRRSQRMKKCTANGKAIKLGSIDERDREGDVKCRSCGDVFENRGLLTKHNCSTQGSSASLTKHGMISFDEAEGRENDLDSDWDAAQTSEQESCGESGDSDFLSDSTSKKRSVKRKSVRVQKKPKKPVSEEKGIEDKNDGGEKSVVQEVFCLEELRCFLCDAMYPALAYGDHVQRCHGLKYHFGLYACLHCGDICTSETVKEFHRQHSGCRALNEDFKCQLCSQNFGSLSQKLQHHRLTHFESSTCSICGQSFETLSYLLWHQNRTYEFLRMILPESLIRSYDAVVPSGEGTCYSQETVLKDVSCSKQIDSDLNENSSVQNQIPPLAAVWGSNNGPALVIPNNSATPLLQCDICYETCDTQGEYYTHHAMHDITLTILGMQCRKCCDIVFLDETKSVVQFYRHHLECETSSTKLTDCLYCSSTFDTAEENINHYYLHHRDYVRCPLCITTIRSKDTVRHTCEQHGLTLFHLSKQCRKCWKMESGITRRQLKTFYDEHADCQAVAQPPSSCFYCGAKIKSENLLQHFSFTDVVKMAECFFCCSRFSSTKDLRAHEVKAHQLSPFVSTNKKRNENHEDTTIGPSLARKFSTTLHQLSIHPAFTPGFKCGICQKILINSFLFKIHLDKAHSGSDFTNVSFNSQEREEVDVFEKYLCGKYLRTESELSEYNNQQQVAEEAESHHHLLESIKLQGTTESTGPSADSGFCAVCKINCLCKEELESHLFTAHNLVLHFAEYGCKKCGSIFTGSAKNVSVLQAFGKAHETCQRIPDNVCSFTNCGFTEKNLLRMMYHFSHVHRWQGAHRCIDCGKTFKSSADFRSHVKRHDPNTPGTEICILAQENFSSINEISECAICNKTFRAQKVGLLSGHVSSRHGLTCSESVYGCSQCGKVFTSSYGKGIKDFAAEHRKCIRNFEEGACVFTSCDFKWRDFSDLLSHYKSNHLKRSEFLCYECGESLSGPFLLRQHCFKKHSIRKSASKILIVAGKTYPPYACSICDKLTFSERRFQHHFSQSHDIEYKQGILSCRTCLEMFVEDSSFSIREFKANHLNCNVIPASEKQRNGYCSKCDIVFYSKVAVRDHFYRHHYTGPKLFGCDACDIRFAIYEDLQKHSESVHSKKLELSQGERKMANFKLEFSYPVLMGLKETSTSTDKSSVTLSAESATPKYVQKDFWECQICRYHCKRQEFLSMHLSKAHHMKLFVKRKKFVYYSCKSCGEFCHTSEESTALTAFFQDHGKQCPEVENIVYRCKVCNEVSSSLKSVMEHHFRNHVPKTFICNICGLGFRCPNRLKRHVQSHLEGTGNYEDALSSDLKCKLCEERVGGLVRMSSAGRKHYKSKHSLVTSCGHFFCSKCYRVFDGTSLIDFVNSHANCPPRLNGSKIDCPQCSYSTQSLPSYLAHELVHLKRFMCEECGKSFSLSFELDRHRLFHKDPYAFKCTGCDVPGCTAAFKSYAGWYSHQTERKHICEKCGRSFSNPSELSGHMTTHERILNVKCDMCDKMFWNRKNMLSHIREVHLKKRKDRWKNKKKSLMQKEQDVDSFHSG